MKGSVNVAGGQEKRTRPSRRVTITTAPDIKPALGPKGNTKQQRKISEGGMVSGRPAAALVCRAVMADQKGFGLSAALAECLECSEDTRFAPAVLGESYCAELLCAYVGSAQ